MLPEPAPDLFRWSAGLQFPGGDACLPSIASRFPYSLPEWRLMSVNFQGKHEMLWTENTLVQATLDAARDAIALWCDSEKPSVFNARFREMWQGENRSSSDLLTLKGISRQLQHGERWFVEMQVLMQQEPIDERIVYCLDGRCISQYSRPISIGGDSQGRVFSFSDVTKQILLERELRYLSTIDALTGLRNRRELLAILEREGRRACRYQHDLGVMVIDIDHFKMINDTWGHEKGDRVLVSVADMINGSIRDSDYAFRTGGEEFLVITPEISPEQLLALAERLCQAVEESGADTGIRRTISIGLATLSQLACGYRESRLLALADAQLYKAKKDGRNRVSIAEPNNKETSTTISNRR